MSANWLTTDALAETAFAGDPNLDAHLPLGPLIGQTGQPGEMLRYFGRAHVMTVAPSGAGKSQALAIPALLAWPGAAIVLDVKGELYYHTAGYRAAEGHKIYRFDPEDEASDQFNPLGFIRSGTFQIESDIRDIARVIIPINANVRDPFWKQRAQEVIEVGIHYLRHAFPMGITIPELVSLLCDIPRLKAGLDILAEGGRIDQDTDPPLDPYPLRAVRNTALSIRHQLFDREDGLNRTGQGVFAELNAQLAGLNTEQIHQLTTRSSWRPEELRDSKTTVYVTLSPKAKGQYREIMALILNAHINAMLDHLPVPSKGLPPVLLLLDEMPQLGRMRAIEQVIDLGRGYGMLLAGFAQRRKQIEEAYGDAGDFLGGFEARVYMNPSPEGESGELLVKALGKKKPGFGTGREPEAAVQLQEICGPKFRESMIVLSRGALPAHVKKRFAFSDPELAKKMAIAPPKSERYRTDDVRKRELLDDDV